MGLNDEQKGRAKEIAFDFHDDMEATADKIAGMSEAMLAAGGKKLLRKMIAAELHSTFTNVMVKLLLYTNDIIEDKAKDN